MGHKPAAERVEVSMHATTRSILSERSWTQKNHYYLIFTYKILRTGKYIDTEIRLMAAKE